MVDARVSYVSPVLFPCLLQPEEFWCLCFEMAPVPVSISVVPKMNLPKLKTFFAYSLMLSQPPSALSVDEDGSAGRDRKEEEEEEEDVLQQQQQQQQVDTRVSCLSCLSPVSCSLEEFWCLCFEMAPVPVSISVVPKMNLPKLKTFFAYSLMLSQPPFALSMVEDVSAGGDRKDAGRCMRSRTCFSSSRSSCCRWTPVSHMSPLSCSPVSCSLKSFWCLCFENGSGACFYFCCTKDESSKAENIFCLFVNALAAAICAVRG